MSSRAGVTHARTPGTPSTLTRQFGQSPLTQYRPRRRWYFSDRVNVRTPPRYIAAPTVSPSSIATRLPSKRIAPVTARRIRFVRVSRVTVSQRRHPNAWNHRSVRGPATLSRRYTRANSAVGSSASSGRSSPP